MRNKLTTRGAIHPRAKTLGFLASKDKKKAVESKLNGSTSLEKISDFRLPKKGSNPEDQHEHYLTESIQFLSSLCFLWPSR